MLKFENVATPATAAAVAVPLRVPLDGFVPMAIVTWFVAVVTTLPCASSMLTVTAGVIMPPADALLGCVANANFAGGPMVTVFADEPQPATNNSATRAENPSTWQSTPPRLNRKSLSITAILFGLSGLQGDRKMGAEPRPTNSEIYDPNEHSTCNVFQS